MRLIFVWVAQTDRLMAVDDVLLISVCVSKGNTQAQENWNLELDWRFLRNGIKFK